LCGGAAALTGLLASPAAKADIQFCNNFPHLIYVAMAYPQYGGSLISRGWISIKTGERSLFDPALRVKTFYYRAESEDYRDGGRKVKMNWDSGKRFAIRESGNFNYWDAQQKVPDSSLADFTNAEETTIGDSISSPSHSPPTARVRPSRRNDAAKVPAGGHCISTTAANKRPSSGRHFVTSIRT
jgi:uncharacterized membrane protein